MRLGDLAPSCPDLPRQTQLSPPKPPGRPRPPTLPDPEALVPCLVAIPCNFYRYRSIHIHADPRWCLLGYVLFVLRLAVAH